MISKKYCVIAAIAGYVVLISLFVYYQQEPSFESECSYDIACVRFCCRDQTTCNETFIRENFNTSGHFIFGGYKVVLGEPKCSKIHVEVDDDESATFLGGGELFLNPRVFLSLHDYCFDDTKVNGEVLFNLLVCDSNETIDKVLKYEYVFMSIAAFFMASTVLVYAHFKELRTDASGKSEFSFVISLFLVSLSLPFSQMYSVTYLQTIATHTLRASSLLSFLWMGVLSFDIWLTIATKMSSETQGDSTRFMLSCFFVYGILVVSFIMGVTQTVSTSLIATIHSIWISIIAISELVFPILSAILLLKLSRSTNLSDHKWFEDQKRRFWIYLQFLLILFVTFVVQKQSSELINGYDAIIVADAIACYSVILIFLSFVLRPETLRTFSDNYGRLFN